MQNQRSLNQLNELEVSLKDKINKNLQDLNAEIWLLRQSGFDHVIDTTKVKAEVKQEEGVLLEVSPPPEAAPAVEVLPSTPAPDASVILVAVNKPAYQNNESQIQALKYLKGLLLFARYANDTALYNAAMDLKSRIKENMSSSETRELADNMALLIKNVLQLTSLKKAHKQLTMARDLAIMLEDSPTICTISQSGNQISKEISRPVKIGANFYDSEFQDLAKKKWFINAKKKAGLQGSETWLDHFFAQELEVFKEKGMPAPPSARWLPHPGNVQDVEIITGTAELKNDEITRDDVERLLDNTTFSSDRVATRFMRMGIISPFKIDDSATEKELGKKILVEVISRRIVEAIKQYQNDYQSFSDDQFFFVNYQTLLSPHRLESHVGALKDNNARFVKRAKEAMNDPAVQEQIKSVVERGVGKKVPLYFAQTNSAINSKSEWPTAKNFDEMEKESREEKFRNVRLLIRKIAGQDPISRSLGNFIHTEAVTARQNFTVSEINKSIGQMKKTFENNNEFLALSVPIQNEIILRVRAAACLRLLLNNQSPYSDLSLYQRNIMRASLEFLTQGEQGIKLVGCKSARDRTAVFAGAVKTMQANPDAMTNWVILRAGIISSLKQGHHFRAMSHHVPVVKVSDVHSDLNKMLDPEMQQYIAGTKRFSKILEQSTTEAEQKSSSVVQQIEAEQALKNKILEFKAHIEANKWDVKKGKEVRFFKSAEAARAGQVSKVINVPSTVFKILDEINKAELKQQPFSIALANIIQLAVEKSSKSTLHRQASTQRFYNDILNEMGFNPIASLSNLENFINKNINLFGKNHKPFIELIERSKKLPHTAHMSDLDKKSLLEAQATQAFYEIITKTRKTMPNLVVDFVVPSLVIKEQAQVVIHTPSAGP